MENKFDTFDTSYDAIDKTIYFGGLKLEANTMSILRKIQQIPRGQRIPEPNFGLDIVSVCDNIK